jgi:hypothetical protein
MEFKYSDLEKQYTHLNSLYNEMKIENAKLSKDIFDKIDYINSITQENKIKTHKLEELERGANISNKLINELEHKLKESEGSVKTKKALYENQVKEMKKEFDKLVKTNETLKKDKDTFKKENEALLDELKVNYIKSEIPRLYGNGKSIKRYPIQERF